MKIARAEWLPYFNALAARMRLGGWGFVISDEPPEGGNAALASINCWYGRFGATIRLSDAFLDESDEEQRYVCVHELVHCYQAHADELISEALSPTLKEAWTLAAEYGVDAAAQTIAPFMPLPTEILCNSNEQSTPGPASLPPSPPSSDCPWTNSSVASATTGARSSGRTYQTPRRDARFTRRR
jgi:hypothetical protein